MHPSLCAGRAERRRQDGVGAPDGQLAVGRRISGRSKLLRQLPRAPGRLPRSRRFAEGCVEVHPKNLQLAVARRPQLIPPSTCLNWHALYSVVAIARHTLSGCRGCGRRRYAGAKCLATEYVRSHADRGGDAVAVAAQVSLSCLPSTRRVWRLPSPGTRPPTGGFLRC